MRPNFVSSYLALPQTGMQDGLRRFPPPCPLTQFILCADSLLSFTRKMLPITGASEQLLQPQWMQQMLPSFEDSCLYDSNPIKACVVEGWSMLVHAGQAITGR